MIKRLKALSVIMVIMSILFFIGGICFSSLAEANRGVGVSFGVMGENGEIITTREGGRIGANSEKEQHSKTGSVVCYILCIGFLVGAIAIFGSAKNIDGMPIINKHGIILEKQLSNLSVLVEFDNGTRQQLIIEPPLIVTEGDKGILGLKRNFLVSFRKDT